MSRMQILGIAFWGFIAIMLAKQFIDYNNKLDTTAVAKKPQHFFFNNPPPTADTGPATSMHGADVQQVQYWTTANPSSGTFTAYVVLKNMGNSRAEGIECSVHPFLGSIPGAGDQRRGDVMSQADPMGQYVKWLTFPDLAPGEMNTQTVDFPIQPKLGPGGNPNPKIHFITAPNNP